MADNEYEDLAAQIMAEKGIGDFNSLDDLIKGRYFFVHGDYPTEPSDDGSIGEYKDKPRKTKSNPNNMPVSNIRLSNTRMPSKLTKGGALEGKFSPQRKPSAGDPVESAGDDESRESVPDSETLEADLKTMGASLFGGGASASDTGEVKRVSPSGSAYPPGYTGPDFINGEAGIPWMKAQRTANRDLAKIYDLLDAGAPMDDPKVQELYNSVMEDIGMMGVGGSKTTGGYTDTQKQMREKATATP